ncbi:YARHG domain-containing protein [uncultured Flavobacterium sp.]|uniref:YARHG domain-containing protein n=1 Tax=uncultured Flavobacterium sp. TaxID=165435 RepID=UPI0025FD8F49|nr:YARHG domain-containing protein [uncultured Flavobacterium sp.]
MKTLQLSIILLLFYINVNAQYIGASDIKDSDLTNWISKFELEYEGVYHFGESESESDLYLFSYIKLTGEIVLIGQIKNWYWEEGTGLGKWKYQNLTDLKIEKNGIFKSNEYSGQFVIYTDEEGNKYKSLKINNPWTTWIEEGMYEIGIRGVLNLKNIYSGKYSKSSYKIFNTEYLNTLSKQELKIMRNEIYARYGYIFKEGGAMDSYFKKQKWYRGIHKNVNYFLTEIELQNIQLIQQIENKHK